MRSSLQRAQLKFLDEAKIDWSRRSDPRPRATPLLLVYLARRHRRDALEAEMAHHLGYDRHDPVRRVAGTPATGRRRRR